MKEEEKDFQKLVEWYVAREKKWLEGKEYTTEHYINVLKDNPHFIIQLLEDNIENYIARAILEGKLILPSDKQIDFKDKVKKATLVSSIFIALQKEFLPLPLSESDF
jgi:hypothetical protein